MESYRNFQQKFFFTIITITLSSLILAVPLSNNSYAHNFAPDESAQFLSLMQLIKAETQLVQTNIDDGNSELANEHAETASAALTPDILNEIAERNERVANDLNSSLTELTQSVSLQGQDSEGDQDVSSIVTEIDAIIDETITVRIDEDQRNNATIQALAFSNVINEILTNYGDAYAVGFDLTDMSNMAGMDMDHGADHNMSMDMGDGMNMSDGMSMDMGDGMNMSDGMSMDMGDGMNMSDGMSMDMDMDMSQNYTLVNLADYQSAEALAEIAQSIFNDELVSMTPESNATTTSVSNLENALTDLNSAIKDEASPMDIMMIVHTQVHPATQTAFNLTLAQ